VRILRLFSRLNVGGPSIHVILLTAGLRDLGYDTRLMVGREGPREGNLLDLAAARRVECERIDALGREIRPWSDLRALWNLYRTMAEYRPAIVHTHTAKAGVLGRIAARLARVPVVVHTYHGHVLHGYFNPAKTRLFGAIEAALGRVTDAVIAVSEAVKADLVRLGVAPASKIRVVPLGLDLEPLTAELPRGVLRAEGDVPAAAPLIGIVGRLVPIKDVGTFLQAAARIRAARADVRFAVVGDGEERSHLEDLARGLGLGGAVHFYGWRRDLAAVYGDLDVVVNCSLNEGTPVALIEALAAGRPVVATRVGGTPDVLGEGSRGTLVAPSDADSLARAILDAIERPQEAGARAQRGREYVLSRHSVARLLSDLDALYRDLLASRAAA
jgi:glycosyltransferase involved in cell wall biosynthesis